MTHIDSRELNNLQEMAKTIRGLSIDGVQKANSGHPGMPMGMADVATVLWMRHLKHDPRDPKWFNRDRFVLSAGHGSMLLYSLLHLTGYDVSLDDLKNFRQWGSKTPGHPEYGHTPGVETTTGPLGQGVANAVGMALAEAHLAERLNTPEHRLLHHYTYVIAGDGCLMEGISHEAASLAGHLKLGKLILLYDDNQISIDGSTGLSFTENVLQRFEAYGWHTQRVDGHDMNAVDQAIFKAREDERPSIIACKTVIGFGSPHMAGTNKVHGSPLGAEEVKLTKEKLGLPADKDFYISEQALETARGCVARGAELHRAWDEKVATCSPEQAALLKELHTDNLSVDLEALLPAFEDTDALATRAASGKTLDVLVPALPQLLGGSADLTGSNNTLPKTEKGLESGHYGNRYIYYGVREHAMGGIMNGLALHGGLIPYGGTFLVFSDYMRNSVRLAAMMGLRVIYVFTHDSIGLGEDGPTHQPIEHLTSLRLIPNLTVIRPADARETAFAWKTAIEHTQGPTALVLTRQKLPVMHEKDFPSVNLTEKGGYILSDADKPAAIIIASGSEVEIALLAQRQLSEEGIATRVVSMPSTELFDAQDTSYREEVLPEALSVRVAIEAGSTLGWHKYVGTRGRIIGIDRYGASAPYKEIYKHYGMTADAVAQAVKDSLKG
ncbi:MAG: transketolase [Calditrichaeota bacterium]|nr:MAG: transketolase [Calditrichota bacterium]